jgi:hypothetical protein
VEALVAAAGKDKAIAMIVTKDWEFFGHRARDPLEDLEVVIRALDGEGDGAAVASLLEVRIEVVHFFQCPRMDGPPSCASGTRSRSVIHVEMCKLREFLDDPELFFLQPVVTSESYTCGICHSLHEKLIVSRVVKYQRCWRSRSR